VIILFWLRPDEIVDVRECCKMPEFFEDRLKVVSSGAICEILYVGLGGSIDQVKIFFINLVVLTPVLQLII